MLYYFFSVLYYIMENNDNIITPLHTDKNIIKMIDSIGFYAPYILLFLTSYFIWNRKVYLLGYLVFFFINIFLNKLLKLTFREPRPDNYQIYDNSFEKTTNEEVFGMPSGHAQSVAFSITFLYLLTKSRLLFIITTFIGALCIYQRWKYRRHTINQLAIGTLVGSSFGGMAYYLITKYMKTKTQIQPQIKI